MLLTLRNNIISNNTSKRLLINMLSISILKTHTL